MAAVIRRRKVTTFPDDPNYDISADEWNDSLVVSGTGALGDLMVRAPAAGDGWQLAASAAGVLSCSGVGALPAFGVIPNSALPASATFTTLIATTAVQTPQVIGGVTPGATIPMWKANGNQWWARRSDDASDASVFAAYFETVGSVRIGTNPATTGAIRLANNGDIRARNAANTLDAQVLKYDSNEYIQLGSSVANGVIPGSSGLNFGTTANPWSNFVASSYVQIGTNPATTGAIRLANAQSIYSRNAANTGDVFFGAIGAGDVGLLGDANVSKWVLNSVSAPFLAFGAATSAFPALSASGTTLTVRLGDNSGYGNLLCRSIGVNANPGAAGDLVVANSLAIGTNPAATGAIRLPNGGYVQARNAANTGDLSMLGLTASNETFIGNSGGPVIPGIAGTHLGNLVQYWGSITLQANAANAGAVRLANNSFVNARNVANSADAALLGADTTDKSVHSGATISVANNGLVNLGPSTTNGFLVVPVTGGAGTFSAIILLRGASAVTVIASDPTGSFSITAGTASRVNVYWSAGNSRYELENKTGSTITVQLTLLGSN